MVILCLSHHCILEANNVFSSFTGPQRGCALRMHHSESPTHTNLDDEVWYLVLTIFR